MELDIVPVFWGQLPAEIPRKIGPADAAELSPSPDLADGVSALVASFEKHREPLSQGRRVPRNPLDFPCAFRGEGFVEVGQQVGFGERHGTSVTRRTGVCSQGTLFCLGGFTPFSERSRVQHRPIPRRRYFRPGRNKRRGGGQIFQAASGGVLFASGNHRRELRFAIPRHRRDA